MSIGISLGWNCHSAAEGVRLGLRERKINGYTTCPFDEAITNYNGVVQCIRDDFKHFFDLTLKEIPETSPFCSGDTLIYNPTYHFLFNHESPGHANLWYTEKWPGGKAYFINDDYLMFKERYKRRIESFRAYLNSGIPIRFLITTPSRDFRDLHEALQDVYPDLTYTIHRFDLDENAREFSYIVHHAMMEAEPH